MNKVKCYQLFVDKLNLKFKHFIATIDTNLSDISETYISDLMGASRPWKTSFAASRYFRRS
jgi:hypothetical protein